MNNGKICVSVCAETASDFVEKIERAAEFADVIELRFDCLQDNEFELALIALKYLREKIQTPFLATSRPKNEDEKFVFARRIYKSEEHEHRIEKAVRERFSRWEKIISREEIHWVDLEVDIHLKLFASFTMNKMFGVELDKEGEEFVKKLDNHFIIVSDHDFDKTPNVIGILKPYDDLWGLAEIIHENSLEKPEMPQLPKALIPNSFKVATQSNEVTDGLVLIKYLEYIKKTPVEFIPIAMGEHGIWTRILGLSRGAFMTFASLDDDNATAPGQLTAEEMIDIYRVKELDENTEIYGLVAGSTAHSVSPQMHNAAFKFHRQNAVYVPFAVKNLEEFIRRMVNPKTREIDWKLRGLSVTIPHKIEIIKYLDFVDETALKIGAVNTIKIVGDELHGFNTDASGFIEPLKNSYGNVKNAKAAVFGAGGAARAVVYALKNEGAEVTVFARDLAKAKNLREDFGVEIKLITDYQSPIISYDIVVNTTPLGMKKSATENETPLTAEQLEGVKLVYDLVYNPFETRLIKEAQSVFVPTIGGLAMLVAQAVEQQKIWTGLDAPVKEMSRAALKKLSHEN